jgi:flagellar protein FlgJ
MTPVNAAQPTLDTWTELSGFNQLRAQAQANDKAALPAVAKQFEAIFTQMMLKSMRDANASIGEGAGDSEQGNSYRDLADQQLSLTLANGSNGIGIAQMLVRQLGGKDPVAPGTGHAPAPAGLATGALPTIAGILSPAAAGVGAGVQALLHLGESSNADATGDALALSPQPAADSNWLATLGSLGKQAAQATGAVGALLPGTDPVNFVRALAPQAQAAADKLGVSVRALLAQAALETGWGKHLPRGGDGSSSNNLFGIKAGQSWGGAKVSVPTVEYQDGVAVRKRDNFRAYDSPSQSFADYAQMLANNPRYAKALGQGENVAGFAHALSRGGYATDPDYAAKLTAIANSPQMREAMQRLQNGAAVPNSF